MTLLHGFILTETEDRGDSVDGTPEIAYIVNPASGRGGGRRVWDRLEPALIAMAMPYSVDFTSGPGDATGLAAAAVKKGARTIVSIGGDGTAHEVVNGYIERGRPINASARVAFIAAGTGNDVSREFPVPDAPLLPDAVTSVDLLRIRYGSHDSSAEERYALFHAGVGLVTEVAETATQLKHRLGKLVYAGGSAVALYRHRPTTLRYSYDDAPFVEEQMNMIVVANSRYAGGGMKLAPSASMQDELLDIVTMRGASRVQMLFRILPAVYWGKHIGHPAIEYRQARTVRVESNFPMSVQLDGEIVGTTPISIDVLPGVLPVRHGRPR